MTIVGASIGGLSTAEALRSLGFNEPISLIGEEPWLPYRRPPLSKQTICGMEVEVALTDEARLRDLGVEFIPSTRITGSDLRSRTITDEAGHVRRFGVLVAATGSRPRRLGRLPNGLVLRTRDDAEAIDVALRSASTVAVVGGGVMALELASAARSRSIGATVLVRGGSLTLGASGALLSEPLYRRARAHDVEVRFHASVATATKNVVTLESGESIAADAVLVAVGADPVTGWLDGNGVDLSDGVLCSESGRFAPDAYAVGDIARWVRPGLAPVRHEHQTNAIAQAESVARAIVGAAATPSVTDYFWSDMFGVRIQVSGHVPVDPQAVVVAGALEGDAFVLGIHDDDTVTGIVGWNDSRGFRRGLSLVGAPRDRAVASVP